MLSTILIATVLSLAAQAAATGDMSCVANTDSRNEAIRQISLDAKLSDAEKRARKDGIPLTLKVTMPSSVTEKRDHHPVAGTLSMGGEAYHGPGNVKADVRYTYATRSFEVEAPSGKTDEPLVLTINNVPTSVFTEAQIEKLTAAFETQGKTVNYTCEPSKPAAGQTPSTVKAKKKPSAMYEGQPEKFNAME